MPDTVTVRPRALRPDARYVVGDLDAATGPGPARTGADLMADGVRCSTAHGDTSWLLLLTPSDQPD
ncbi:MAG: hypothetical protein WCA46_19575, partial [Actinocatenispora sp.]